MASTSDVLKDFVAKHGNAVGDPYVTNPTITTETPVMVGGKPTGETTKTTEPNPDPVYHYTFADGSTLDVTGQSGQVKAVKEATPPGTQTPKGGPLSDFQQITDDKGNPLKLYNPTTGQVIDLPDVKPGQQAQVFGSAKDGYYAWDGQKITPLTQGQPDKPQIVNGSNGAIYSWDGSNLTLQQPGTAPARHVAVVGNNLVDTDSGKVVYQGQDGIKFQTAQDGTVLAIDPNNPSNVQTIWSPPQKPSLVPGQSPNQKRFLQQNPDGSLTAIDNPIAGDQQPTEVSGQNGPNILQRMPDGSYQSVPNPAYQSKQQQALTDLHAGINQIQQQLASGQIDVATANKYKDLLQQNYDATLRGTTPYQQYQDQQTLQQNRARMGADLLNQRVQSGTSLANSLLNSAVGIVGNKNFMDPSALAGLSIFGPANNVPEYINQLGGGSDVYNAASSALKSGLGSDPATALLSAALSSSAMSTPAQSTAAGAIAPAATGAPAPAPTYSYTPETAAQSMQRNMLNAAAGRPSAVQLLLQGAGITA